MLGICCDGQGLFKIIQCMFSTHYQTKLFDKNLRHNNLLAEMLWDSKCRDVVIEPGSLRKVDRIEVMDFNLIPEAFNQRKILKN